MLTRLKSHRRILLTGAPGVGKSTLAAQLAAYLAADQRACACIGCDPGSPAFGIPGAVCLGSWQDERWQLLDFEPMCSLDAVRFRLPLAQAVRRLLQRVSQQPLLLDAPGVVRGLAGAELLSALAMIANIDAVVVLERGGASAELDAELDTLAVPVYRLPAADEARAPSARARARQRTALWDAHLLDAKQCQIALDALPCLGTPPPRDAPAAWVGRQIALLRDRDCVAIGEITTIEGNLALARVCGRAHGASALLVRDAQRGTEGLLQTAKPFAADVGYGARAELVPAARRNDTGGLRLVTNVGPFVATLINGVFGDPLLLVQTRHGRRTLLFDLGEAGRLRARITHAVTDVFISHAHIDHIAGFMWFLRSRIAELPPCRVFGPPGLAKNIAGMVAGVHWDRVGQRGPRFEVAELHGAERLLRFSVCADEIGPRSLGEETAPSGTLLADPLLRVRAIVLDHGTPVLAFALDANMEIKVRKERLAALGLPPGSWLTELKRRIVIHDHDAVLDLPNGAKRSVRDLASELLIIRPGEKLVYATDFADTAHNRETLTSLAAGAHTFFCEATFCEADAKRAARTGHLTARACGEIAEAAGVERLVPFHFSRRYEGAPRHVYDEVRAACARTVVEAVAGHNRS